MAAMYNELLSLDVSANDFNVCVNRLGGPAGPAPDGTPGRNPRRKIAEDVLDALGEPWRRLVEDQICQNRLNTSCTASRWLVAAAAVLDSSGKRKSFRTACDAVLDARASGHEGENGW